MPSVFESVGGEAAFFDLVARFYAAVEEDVVLRPVYPDDLAPARRHLTLFLIQYFGGPQTYSSERGHPRLRLRHSPFVIDRTARDHWMAHMRTALSATALPETARVQMLAYFEKAADSLINQWPAYA